MHQSFYNSNKTSSSECLMSLEFNNGQNQQKHHYNQKKQTRGGVAANRQSQENMIKEEQHEEISEEDDDSQERGSSPYARKKEAMKNNHYQMPYESAENNNSQSVDRSSAYPNASQAQQNEVDSRPSNRLGCSRAFHQTKENWSFKENGSHSLPRNANNNHTSNTQVNNPYPNNINQQVHNIIADPSSGNSGQYSCKATSSATSLTLINKQSSNPQQNIATTNHSSVSPKPYHKNQGQQQANWSGINPSNNNISTVSNAQKIQEMQKEVNLMYLGGISGNKKKAGAGVKLNPIARPNGADPGSNYIL